jgi:hypothetical protein
MPQFVIPQFIDVEDKIIGPITTRQFLMGMFSVFLLFLSYKLADIALFILQALFIIGFYVLFGFIKVNGRPSYYFFLSMIRSFKRPKLRVWSKSSSLNEYNTVQKDQSSEEKVYVGPRKILKETELSSLALLLDTGGKYRPEELLRKEEKQPDDLKI